MDGGKWVLLAISICRLVKNRLVLLLFLLLMRVRPLLRSDLLLGCLIESSTHILFLLLLLLQNLDPQLCCHIMSKKHLFLILVLLLASCPSWVTWLNPILSHALPPQILIYPSLVPVSFQVHIKMTRGRPKNPENEVSL